MDVLLMCYAILLLKKYKKEKTNTCSVGKSLTSRHCSLASSHIPCFSIALPQDNLPSLIRGRGVRESRDNIYEYLSDSLFSASLCLVWRNTLDSSKICLPFFLLAVPTIEKWEHFPGKNHHHQLEKDRSLVNWANYSDIILI